jgi:Phage related hypothetical protein (DUF1799).
LWGLTEDEATPQADVWAENLSAVNCFIAMSTQWRVGLAGATGLDYGALPAVLRMNGTPRSEWSEIFDSIRVLEETALQTMRKK